MLSVERVAATVLARIATNERRIFAFWCNISEGRQAYAELLEKELGGLAAFVTVIRDDRFDNANSLLSDLNELISENRELIEPRARMCSPDRPFVVVLISRSQFQLPQIASPIVMPNWFPSFGGQTIDVIVEDLTRTSKSRVNCAEARLESICSMLFILENTLRKRLELVVGLDHNKTNAFFEMIKDEKVSGDNLKGFLEAARLKSESVRHAESYRPSAKEGSSVIGRLMRVISKSSPDELPKRARAFATAVDLPEDVIRQAMEPLLGVLFRSVFPIPDLQIRFGRNVLLAVFAASQLVTAAAHSDDYSEYPVIYLQAISYDIRMTLQSVITAIAGG